MNGPIARWCIKHPAWCATLWLGGLGAGFAFLTYAASRSAPLQTVAGLVSTTFGLLFLDRYIRGACEEHPFGWLIVGAISLSASCWVIRRGFQDVSASRVAVGVILGLVALVVIGRVLVVLGARQPGVWTTLGVALTAIGALAAALEVQPVIGGAIALLGLLLLRVGVGPLCERSPQAAKGCFMLGAGWTTLGCSVLVWGTYRSLLSVSLLGAFLLIVGLIPLTAGWLALDVRPIGANGAMLIGASAASIGFFFFPRDGAEWVPRIVALLIAAIGVSFSWRGEGFLVAAVIGFVLVWVLVDRVDHAPLDPNPNAPERILALGDSYISGEGSTTFFPQTNLVGNPENQCRRSSTAYPYLVASDLGMGLDFFACSGAIATQIDDVGQMPDSPAGVDGKEAQLNDPPANVSRIRAVLVSIGGNDAQFGDIGIACVLPGSCAQLRETWLVNVGRIGNGITKAFNAIRDKYGASVPIIAIPYPSLLTEEGCDWSAFNRSEHEFLSEFVTILDDRVRKSAEQAGIHYFAKGLFAFQGRRICDGQGPNGTVMNFFNFHPTEGGFLDRINPTNWLHGTFHPKPAGHEAIAKMLEPRLTAILAKVSAGKHPNPEPNPAATFEVPRVELLKTVLVNPRTALPTDEEMCPFQKVSPFATILPLVDAQDTFKLDAQDSAPICHTRPDGSWTDGEQDLDRSGELVQVQPELPDKGFKQLFVYEANDDTWQLRIVEYCNRNDNCPHDVHAWTVEQLALAARNMIVPILLMLIGSWLGALGLRRKLVQVGAVMVASEQ